MERVTFIVEESGERIVCLLNPEALEAHRVAGIARRSDANGTLAGPVLQNDALVATGGGTTELILKLLFDLDVAVDKARDVREHSGKLWKLAENGKRSNGASTVPLVRFIWGKSWNVLGVVLEVSERLECFDANGAPRRSWMSMRLRQANDPPAKSSATGPPASSGDSGGGGQQLPGSAAAPPTSNTTPGGSRSQSAGAPVLALPVDDAGVPLERFDVLASRLYGDPGRALALAEHNNIDDPLNMPPGTLVALPPASVLPRRP